MIASKTDIFFVLLQFALFAAYLFEVHSLEIVFPSDIRNLFLPFVAFGILMILISMLQLNKNLSPFPSPKKQTRLITTGLFDYIRHPIYSGIIITAIFFALYFNSGYKILISLLLLWLFYHKSVYEEKKLLEKFPEYESYKLTTGRFFPRF